MQSCTKLQAVTSNASSTATETGLIAAYNLVKAKSQGGTGRENTQKVVVLLTDGMPNLKSSSNSAVPVISAATPVVISITIRATIPRRGIDADKYDAAKHWKAFAVGVGLQTDNNFMDRMARMEEPRTIAAKPHEPAAIRKPTRPNSERSSNRSSIRQKSVSFNKEWAVGSGQWTVDSGQWTVDSGQWTVDSGQWTVDSGQWTVDSGQWTVDSLVNGCFPS